MALNSLGVIKVPSATIPCFSLKSAGNRPVYSIFSSAMLSVMANVILLSLILIIDPSLTKPPTLTLWVLD